MEGERGDVRYKMASNALAVDADMDTAFFLVAVGPTAGTIVLAGGNAARARHATDGGITVVDQRVARQSVLLRVGFDLRQGPIRERIETKAALEELNRLHLGALARLKALAPSDLGRKRF